MNYKELKMKSFPGNIKATCMLMLLAAITFTFTGCEDDNDEITTYIVTFDAEGGSPTPPTQHVEAGEMATAPSVNPVKTGYEFMYWHLEGNSTAYNFQTPVNRDITLHAKWQDEAVAEYWQVTWELNGGIWQEGDHHATQVLRGGTLTEPNAPVKSGYALEGWYAEADLTNKIHFPYDVSAITTDFTLYAKWEDADKADYYGTWRVVLEDGWEQFTISADEIVWLNSNGFGFTKRGLTWTVIDDPGRLPTDDYPVDYRITGTIISNNGYSIPKADGIGNCSVGDLGLSSYYLYAERTSIGVGNFETAEQEIRYGPYKKKTDVEYWKVEWNLNGGTWPENDNHDVQAAKDGSLAAPASPTKKDNNFGGWYKESSLTNKVSFPYDMSGVTGDFTLYAKWDDATPSVTLKVSVTPLGGGYYASITAMRVSSGSPSQYSIPTSYGTHTVKVSPGTYRIFYSYWACQTVNCMSSGFSSNFTVSSGQTKNISLVGAAVGF